MGVTAPRFCESVPFSMLPESGWLMPQNTPCERCQRVGFVRPERIFTGKNLTLSYYCSVCDHSWQTPYARSASICAWHSPTAKR